MCAPTAKTDPSSPWGTQREVKWSAAARQRSTDPAHGMNAAACPAETPQSKILRLLALPWYLGIPGVQLKGAEQRSASRGRGKSRAGPK